MDNVIQLKSNFASHRCPTTLQLVASDTKSDRSMKSGNIDKQKMLLQEKIPNSIPRRLQWICPSWCEVQHHPIAIR